MEEDWKPAPEWGADALSYVTDATPHPLLSDRSNISVGRMRAFELRSWMVEIRSHVKAEHPNLVPGGSFFNQLICHSLGEELDWEGAGDWATTHRLWSTLDMDGLTSFYPALSQYKLTEEQFYALFRRVNEISDEGTDHFFDLSPFTMYVDVVDQFFMNPLFSSAEVVARLVEHLTKDLTRANTLALTLLFYSSTAPYQELQNIRASLPAEVKKEVTELADEFDTRWLKSRSNGSISSQIKVAKSIMRMNPEHPSVKEVHELINAVEVPRDSSRASSRADLPVLIHFASAQPDTDDYLGKEFQDRVRLNLGRLGYNWVNSDDPVWRMNVEPAILPYVAPFKAHMAELGLDPSVIPAEWVSELLA